MWILSTRQDAAAQFPWLILYFVITMGLSLLSIKLESPFSYFRPNIFLLLVSSAIDIIVVSVSVSISSFFLLLRTIHSLDQFLRPFCALSHHHHLIPSFPSAHHPPPHWKRTDNFKSQFCRALPENPVTKIEMCSVSVCVALRMRNGICNLPFYIEFLFSLIRFE